MGERRVRAAAVQFDARPGDVPGNVERLLALCRSGTEQGCQLLVLPELATTGYGFGSREALEPLVEPVPGPTTDRFAWFAAQHQCHIVVGLPEVEPDTGFYYNTAVLVGPGGVAGRMRKVHLDVWDSYRVRAGDLGFPVWETPAGRLACQICMDACFPESSRLPALQQIDCLCLPTAWFGERTPAGDWLTRAYENEAYFIAANRWGREGSLEFSGGSCIISPAGQVLACRAEGDGLAMADLDLPARDGGGMKDRGGSRLAERRPEFYHDLIQSRQAWTYRFARQPGTPGHMPDGQAFGLAVGQTGEIADTTAEAQSRAAELIRQAAASGARLVVLPELALLGQPEQAASQAEPVPGPSTDWAARLCQEFDAYVVFGLAELAGGQRYNSAVLVGPKGILAVYRKLHLSPEDRRWATLGQTGWQVCDLPVGRIGLMLGDDAAFPESARCLALRGADVICAPSAVRGPRPMAIPPATSVADEPSWHLWRTRAGENNVFLAFANRSDQGYMGHSGIFGPDVYRRPRQEALVETTDAGWSALVVDTRDFTGAYTPNPARTKDWLRMRQPALYAPLVRPAGEGAIP